LRKKNIDDIRNPFEVGVYKQLLAAKKGLGLKDLAYESENLPYTIQADYIPDFVVTRQDGSKLYIESKGWLRPEDKKKMTQVRKAHPDLDIRILFQRNNRFTRSKTTYGMWADKIGYQWAVGEIPREWLVG
jgi:predicted nuclease of restriction endonuclease-like RecB superfamily